MTAGYSDDLIARFLKIGEWVKDYGAYKRMFVAAGYSARQAGGSWAVCVGRWRSLKENAQNDRCVRTH